MRLLLVFLLACKTQVVCETVLTPDGTPSGLERCWPANRDPSSGQLNRSDLVLCPPGVLDLCDGSSTLECGLGEVCAVVGRFPACVRPCGNDAECGSSAICACPVEDELLEREAATCSPGECRDANDCLGEPCGVMVSVHGAWIGAFCRSDRDACDFDVDCDDGLACISEGGPWKCAERPRPGN